MRSRPAAPCPAIWSRSKSSMIQSFRTRGRGGSGCGRAAGSGGPARTRPSRRRAANRPNSRRPGTSAPSNVRSYSAVSRSSSARSASTSLCGDAHAPIWLPRGRDAKYASLSSSADALDRAAEADLPMEVEPGEHGRRRRGGRRAGGSSCSAGWCRRRSIGRRRHERARPWRPDGRRAPTVATVIAFGSVTPAALASAYQRCHWASGSSATSATSSPAVSYCTRRDASSDLTASLTAR